MSRFELLDTTTSEVVVQADSLVEVAEVRAVLAGDDVPIEDLVLIQWDDDDDHPSLVG